MQLIKVKIHIAENVNGNKNNPGPDSHIFEPHTFHPPEGQGARSFLISAPVLGPANGEKVAQEAPPVPTE